jgi:hypothetical protein
VRRAVLHVNLDPGGTLGVEQLERAVEALRDAGHEVLAGDLDRLPPGRREVELLLDGDDPDELRQRAEAALAPGAQVVAVSFMSSGTYEDALGIVRAFGLEPELEEIELVDEDTAVVVLADGTLRRAVSVKLQTALECALNREVLLRD